MEACSLTCSYSSAVRVDVFFRMASGTPIFPTSCKVAAWRINSICALGRPAARARFAAVSPTLSQLLVLVLQPQMQRSGFEKVLNAQQDLGGVVWLGQKILGAHGERLL